MKPRNPHVPPEGRDTLPREPAFRHNDPRPGGSRGWHRQMAQCPHTRPLAMTMQEASRLYQDACEALRRDPDDEVLIGQARQAREALELAWLGGLASYKPRGLL